MGERLEEYIKSNRRSLPRDIKFYDTKRQGERSHLCIFCETTDHDNIPVFEYTTTNAYVTTRQGTSCYMCHSCDEVIEMHFLDSEEYGDYDNDTSPTTSKDEVPTQKLTTYLSSGKFHEDVHSYYFFLNPEIDLYTTDYTLSVCYFCGSNNLSNHSLVEVPVDNDYNIVGGLVKVCHDCLFILERTKTVDNEIKDICSKCNKHYLITFEEYDSRKSDSSIGLHMCPTCTHNVLHLYHKSPIKNLRPHFNKSFEVLPVRLLNVQCPTCKESSLIDLTVHEDIVKSVFCKNNIIVCIECLNKYDSLVDIHTDLYVSVKEIEDHYTLNLYLNSENVYTLNGYKDKGILNLISEMLELYYSITKHD